MRSKALAMGLLASSILVSAASAQQMNNTSSPPGATPRATTMTTTKVFSDQWRTSKLMGLDIYNEQNEKLGDISEIILDKTGKVDSVIIGVGGFLGVGTREIKVTMDKLKFVNEPVPSSSASRTSGYAWSSTKSRCCRRPSCCHSPTSTRTRISRALGWA